MSAVDKQEYMTVEIRIKLPADVTALAGCPGSLRQR